MARVFLQIFSLARAASSVISVMTILAVMLTKPKCNASDYLNLASSLLTCYGTLTSPQTAKRIFESVQNEYRMAQFNDTRRAAEIAAAAGAGLVGATGLATTANAETTRSPDGDTKAPLEDHSNDNSSNPSQPGTGASGNLNDPDKPNHNVKDTETFRNNPTTNKAGIREDPPTTDAEKEAIIKKRDELAGKMIVIL